MPGLISPCCFQVSEELIRVAILWHEMWHEGLEEASRLYFGERNVKGMFEVLEPLHAMMERGPQTLKETSFNQVGTRRYKMSKPETLMRTPSHPPSFRVPVFSTCHGAKVTKTLNHKKVQGRKTAGTPDLAQPRGHPGIPWDLLWNPGV